MREKKSDTLVALCNECIVAFLRLPDWAKSRTLWAYNAPETCEHKCPRLRLDVSSYKALLEQEQWGWRVEKTDPDVWWVLEDRLLTAQRRLNTRLQATHLQNLPCWQFGDNPANTFFLPYDGEDAGVLMHSCHIVKEFYEKEEAAYRQEVFHALRDYSAQTGELQIATDRENYAKYLSRFAAALYNHEMGDPDCVSDVLAVARFVVVLTADRNSNDYHDALAALPPVFLKTLTVYRDAYKKTLSTLIEAGVSPVRATPVARDAGTLAAYAVGAYYYVNEDGDIEVQE